MEPLQYQNMESLQTQNLKFLQIQNLESPEFLQDEEFVTHWVRAVEGVFPQFPQVDLTMYQSLETKLYQSFAGRIPVLHLKERPEFEHLLCAIFYKGEARPIPQSMGATAIKGWKDVSGQGHRVILLSDGYYSNVQPEQVGLTPEVWKQKSFLLRRAHECAHYYTLRAHGFMNNALKDELIADAMGLIEAFGSYRRELFLLFMGLEEYPAYRKGGRLENYMPRDGSGTDKDFQDLIHRAFEKSGELEEFLMAHPDFIKEEAGKLRLLNYLSSSHF